MPLVMYGRAGIQIGICFEFEGQSIGRSGLKFRICLNLSGKVLGVLV